MADENDEKECLRNTSICCCNRELMNCMSPMLLSLAFAYPTTAPQGKTPIFVKDVPGFFVNRCLSPFMTEVSDMDVNLHDSCGVVMLMG